MKGFNNKFFRRTTKVEEDLIRRTTKVEEDFIHISEKEASILAEKLEELNHLRNTIKYVREDGVFYKDFFNKSHQFKGYESLIKRVVISVLKDREKELRSFFYKTKNKAK